MFLARIDEFLIDDLLKSRGGLCPCEENSVDEKARGSRKTYPHTRLDVLLNLLPVLATG